MGYVGRWTEPSEDRICGQKRKEIYSVCLARHGFRRIKASRRIQWREPTGALLRNSVNETRRIVRHNKYPPRGSEWQHAKSITRQEAVTTYLLALPSSRIKRFKACLLVLLVSNVAQRINIDVTRRTRSSVRHLKWHTRKIGIAKCPPNVTYFTSPSA